MSKPPITTAIIGDNGFTTRRLPISATIPKGFTPIGNRPVVDFIVDELVKVGVEDIYFVIHPYHQDIYERYFLGNDLLDKHLAATRKDTDLNMLKALRGRAQFHFVTKTERYGTAIPPLLAFEDMGGFRSCIYMASDDFTYRSDGGSDLVDLVELYASREAVGGLLGLHLPDEMLSKFGVMQVESREDVCFLKNLIEKPEHPEKLEGTLLANIGKHIIGTEMEPYFQNLKAHPVTGEYFIVDVYAAVAREHEVVVLPVKGDYYDVGNLDNWMNVNKALAKIPIDLKQ
ncbi:MAG TPA: sugar phosphate nucleotidyltransferase [Candidatus Saccharimonadia bacterium]